MKFYRLDPQEAAQRRATHVAQFDYTDLTDTAGTAKTIAIASSIAAGTRMAFVGHQLDTLFDGGSTSELVAKIGWDLGSGTDDDDGFLADVSLHADATYVKYSPVAIADVSTETVDETYGTQESTVLASLRTKLNPLLKQGVKVFNDTATLNVIWTSTGANLTALTAGQVKFFFAINNAVAA